MVFLACEFTGRKWENSHYVLLGDDILIGDPVVGKAYRELVTLLGVEVSPTKTYCSTELSEFAKRLMLRGEEVTPFPISSIVNVHDSPGLVVASLEGAERKGYVPASGVPGAVGTLAVHVKAVRGKGRKGLIRRKTEAAARCQ